MIYKIKKYKKYIALSVLVLLLLVVPKHFALASLGGDVAGFLSWVLIWIGWVMGKIISILMKVLTELFKFQDFTNNGVNMGWAAARDVANMFFILILLVISFATILRLENYSMKRYLPKLLLMAVLINYSKTITLLAIDFSQIIMLTFANAFTGTESNFVKMLQLDKLTEINSNSAIDFNDANILYGVALYVLFILISLCVFLMLIGILIMRMVMFWILIVLSPLAFMAYAMPGGSSYFSRWMGELTKYLIVGPVLAFFTWLSMVTMSAALTVLQNVNLADTTAATSAIIKMGDTANVMSFITAIGMLVGTIKITQSIGAMGGGFGANMASSLKNKGVSFAKGATIGAAGTAALWSRKKAWDGTKMVSGAGGRLGLGLARSVDRGIGDRFGMQGGLAGTAIQAVGHVTTGKFYRNASLNKFEADKARFDQHKNGGELEYQGKKYKKTTDGTGRFMHTDEKGKISYATRKNMFGREVELKEMDKMGAGHFMAMSSARGNAMAAAKMATDAKIAEETKKINASGMSNEMKLHRLRDGSASESEKQAIALDLAESAGFKGKTHDDVKMAKSALGSNQILLKKFNDAIDKKFAHLNYDMKTQEGRDAFQKRLEKGNIDEVMDKSAYEGETGMHVLETVKKSRGGSGFDKYVNRVGETATHKESIANGLAFAAGEGKYIDKNKALEPMRKSLIELTGNIGDALRGMKIPAGAEHDLQNAINSLVKGMTNKQIANLSADNFDVDKMMGQMKGSRDDAEKVVKAIELAVSKNMGDKEIEAVRRHPDSTTDLMEKLEKFKKKEVKTTQGTETAKKESLLVDQYGRKIKN